MEIAVQSTATVSFSGREAHDIIFDAVRKKYPNILFSKDSLCVTDNTNLAIDYHLLKYSVRGTVV